MVPLIALLLNITDLWNSADNYTLRTKGVELHSKVGVIRCSQWAGPYPKEEPRKKLLKAHKVVYSFGFGSFPSLNNSY